MDANPIPSTSAISITPPPRNEAAYEFYEKVMGSPKYIVAPMVEHSELAWRILSRLHGAHLVYTPMIHSAHYSSSSSYRLQNFDLRPPPTSFEGSPRIDRPLSVQFCANDANIYSDCGDRVALGEEGFALDLGENRCDAVDLNLGCPQGIAKKGHYGAFLINSSDEKSPSSPSWSHISSMLRKLSENSNLKRQGVIVTAKMRVFDKVEDSIRFAKMLQDEGGVRLLTVHGRTREMKGQWTGLADWDQIQAIKKSLSIPVFANGNILSHFDVERCLAHTACDGVMSAEGNLYNPAIFSPLSGYQFRERYLEGLPGDLKDELKKLDQALIERGGGLPSEQNWFQEAVHPPVVYVTNQYLTIVRFLARAASETPGAGETSLSSIRSHIFKLWKCAWDKGRHLEFRERIAAAGGNKGEEERSYLERVDDFNKLTDEFQKKLEEDVSAGLLPSKLFQYLPLPPDGEEVPWSHCQQHVRPLPPEVMEKLTEDKMVLYGLKSPEDKGSNGLKRGRESPDCLISTKLAKIDPSLHPSQLLKPSIKCRSLVDCGNVAAERCSHGFCKTCCEKKDEEEGTECDFHVGKKKKRAEAKRTRSERKKEGKRKAVKPSEAEA